MLETTAWNVTGKLVQNDWIPRTRPESDREQGPIFIATFRPRTARLSRASQPDFDTYVRLNGANEASSFIKRSFVNPRVLPLLSSMAEYTTKRLLPRLSAVGGGDCGEEATSA